MSTIYIAVMFPINTLAGSHNTKVVLNVTRCKEEDAKPYSQTDFLNDSQKKIVQRRFCAQKANTLEKMQILRILEKECKMLSDQCEF